MKPVPKDYFAEKAKDYDKLKTRTNNVDTIAYSILKEVPFTKAMQVLDFGSGTGLLLSNIAPHVGSITAVDISASMNEVLRAKINNIDGEVKMLAIDLTKEPLDKKFNAIISSMTLHHIEDVALLFKKFYNLLHKNGIIAIADLDKEDGSFHTTATGMFHCGFCRDEFLSLARRAGFRNLKIQTASIIEKPTGNYPVFLLTGNK